MTGTGGWAAPAPSIPDPPLVGEDRPMLEGYLDWTRATLSNVCAGLSAEQLAARPIASTNLSLLGLLPHMAKVERVWFRQRAAGEQIAPVYAPGRDEDFEDIHPADARHAVAQFTAETKLARAAVAALPWDTPVQAREDVLSLRMVHVHMIGEYSRHNGHADLLRQAIDGVTGR